MAQKNYAILTTARSGSNLLCSYLINTGVLGRPAEYFNPKTILRGVHGYELDGPGTISAGHYIEWLKEKRATKNGIFGVKILYEDFDAFRSMPAFRAFLNSCEIFYLHRQSKTRQAVSYYIAEISGQWIAEDPPLVPLDKIEYNFERIHKILLMLVRQDVQWREHLSVMRRAYKSVSVEEFLKSPEGYVHATARALDVPTEGLKIVAGTKEQKNDLNERFSAQLLKDMEANLFKVEEKREYHGLNVLP